MKVRMLCTMALLSGGAIAAVAQDRPSERPEQPQAQAQTQRAETAASSADVEIAAMKLAEHRNEIELAKLAQQKSQNEKVREFAAKMIKDHGEAVSKLEKVAGPFGQQRNAADPRGAADNVRERQNQPGTQPPTDPENRGNVQVQAGRAGVQVDVGARANRGSLNWMAIHQEIAARCLASAKRELASKEGAEFDHCYIGMQIVAHQKMIDSDQVFANYVSADQRDTLEECVKTAQEHLREAKEIMDSLAGKKDNVRSTTSRE